MFSVTYIAHTFSPLFKWITFTRVKRIFHLPTYVPTYLRTYLRTYVPTYLPTYLPTCLTTYLPTYLSTYQPTYIPTYLSIYLLSIYLSVYLYDCLFLVLCCRCFWMDQSFDGWLLNNCFLVGYSFVCLNKR